MNLIVGTPPSMAICVLDNFISRFIKLLVSCKWYSQLYLKLVTLCREKLCRFKVQDMEFVKLERQHADEVVSLMADMFMKHEPTFSCLKVPVGTATHYCKLVVNRAINDNVSLVAITTKENKIVGAIANFLDDGEPIEGDINDTALLRPMTPISSIVDLLKARFYDLEEVKELQQSGNVFMELHMVAVRDGYHGQGIARRLIQESLLMGMAKGAKMAYGEATNPITQHITQGTLGFVQVGEMIEYTTFEYDDKRPFSDMPAAYMGAILVVKSLNYSRL
ncbi:uncharacterized protein [Ptychodera flava]|uniref:uncharacterized protein n=1 Tax=Ptychodera flava TaxID=63121 RepID=UPI00396A8694